ncbi:hypothetical protein AAMO2058_001272600 [Amorphochlora amoebiformis]
MSGEIDGLPPTRPKADTVSSNVTARQHSQSVTESERRLGAVAQQIIKIESKVPREKKSQMPKTAHSLPNSARESATDNAKRELANVARARAVSSLVTKYGMIKRKVNRMRVNRWARGKANNAQVLDKAFMNFIASGETGTARLRRISREQKGTTRLTPAIEHVMRRKSRGETLKSGKSLDKLDLKKSDSNLKKQLKTKSWSPFKPKFNKSGSLDERTRFTKDALTLPDKTSKKTLHRRAKSSGEVFEASEKEIELSALDVLGRITSPKSAMAAITGPLAKSADTSVGSPKSPQRRPESQFDLSTDTKPKIGEDAVDDDPDMKLKIVSVDPEGLEPPPPLVDSDNFLEKDMVRSDDEIKRNVKGKAGTKQEVKDTPKTDYKNANMKTSRDLKVNIIKEDGSTLAATIQDDDKNLDDDKSNDMLLEVRKRNVSHTSVLRKPPESRQTSDMMEIYKYLESFAFFRDYLQNQMSIETTSARLAFCRHVRYMRVNSGFTLFRQGDCDQRFFMVISGKAAIIVVNRGKEKLVAEVSTGEHFGEIAMKQVNGIRTATVLTTEDSEFLYLDKIGFDAVFNQIEENDLIEEGLNLEEQKNMLGPIARNAKYDRTGRLRTLEERIGMAIKYIRAAQASRKVKTHRFNPPYASQIDDILSSSTFSYLFLFMAFAHLALAVWEPPSRLASNREYYATRKWACIAFEWIIVTYFSLAFFGQWYNMGRYFWTRLNCAWAFCLSLFFLDVLIATGSGFAYLRFSRFFRPFTLLLRINLLRIAYSVSLRTLTELTHIWIVLGLQFLIFACIGLYLFNFQRDIYNMERYSLGTSAGYRCQGRCPDLPDWVFTSFSSFEQTLITLFVLLTTENYPEVSQPAYMVNGLYEGYFILFWILGEAFLLQLLIALVFNVYKELMEGLVLQQMWNERFALHCAFECLDIQGSGHITRPVFKNVLVQIKPKFNDLQCEAFFQLMDVDENGLLEEKEFYDFCDFIKYDIGVAEDDAEELELSAAKIGDQSKLNRLASRVTSGGTIRPAMEFNSWTLFFVSERCLIRLAEFLKSRAHDRVTHFLIFCDLIILIAYGVDTSSTENNGVTNVLQTAMWAVFAFDHLLVILVLGLKFFFSQRWYQFDMTVDLITFVGVIAAFSENDLLGFLRFFGMLRSLRLARLFEQSLQIRKEKKQVEDEHARIRLELEEEGKSEEEIVTAIRALDSTKPKAKMTILDTMINMVPWFIFMCMAMSCVLMYAYAMLGLELFPSVENACNGSDWIENEPTARFCDFPAAVLTLFQIVTTSNWHEIMYPAIQRYDTPVALYFCSFYFFAAIIMFNIMTAVFIEVFQTIQEESEFSDDHQGVTLDELLQRKNNDKKEDGTSENKRGGDSADLSQAGSEVKWTSSATHKKNTSVRSSSSMKHSHVWVKKTVSDVLDHGLKKAFGTKDSTTFSPKAMQAASAISRKRPIAKAYDRMKRQSTRAENKMWSPNAEREEFKRQLNRSRPASPAPVLGTPRKMAETGTESDGFDKPQD